MERLTIFDEERGEYLLKDFDKAVDKLAHYENLEEQGRLITLESEDNSVYIIENRYSNCNEYYIYKKKYVSTKWVLTHFNEFGKTIFLTEEAAKQKLEDIKLNNTKF